MTKLIPSASLELGIERDRVQKLIQRNNELQEEIFRLRACLKKNGLALPMENSSSPAPKTPITERHYLASTKASRNRSIQSQLKAPESPSRGGYVVVGSKRYRYEDGVLFNNPQDGEPHYLWPTRSSTEKWRPKYRAYLLDEEYDSDAGYESWGASDSTVTDGSEDENNQELEEEVAEETTEKSICEQISEKSELWRYIEPHLSTAPIRSEVVYSLLSRSLRLAQEVLYDGSKKYLPKLYQKYDGPHEVRFGWSEMQSAFFQTAHFPTIIAGKQYHRCGLELIVDEITQIRNKVCHFTGCSSFCRPDSLDDAIKDVQEFAAIFGDEVRASQARAMRDELREEAEKALSELESMWLLAELPGARPWERHQLFSFWSVLYCSRQGESVVRAAKDWEQQHQYGDSRIDSWPPLYVSQNQDLLNSWTDQL